MKVGPVTDYRYLLREWSNCVRQSALSILCTMDNLRPERIIDWHTGGSHGQQQLVDWEGLHFPYSLTCQNIHKSWLGLSSNLFSITSSLKFRN